MNKSKIRKKILKIRKQNNLKNLNINFQSLIKILRNKKICGKILGGYYPYNFEIDSVQILKKLRLK